ncbi:MAG: putative transport system ATP-binding protein [Patescibacteria group bacterium]|nr:putative transport system ATP-binding protein [Patescibacteria group bacterium]
MAALIETKKLVKAYKSGDGVSTILKGIDFSVERGEFVSIMGRSGAGKSTLMYQMSLLDEPTSGDISIDGTNTRHMSEKEKAAFRLRKFGFVFQDYALMPELTATENIVLPLLMESYTFTQAQAMAADALTRVGLGHRLHNVPSQLSGGEQQRVSIARAIAEQPEILFADEPTANLDRESAKVVIDLFLELHAHGQTIIMVTHEEEYGHVADRIIRLDEGSIVSIEKGVRHAHARKQPTKKQSKK